MSQTFSFQKKRSANATLVCEQAKKARMSVEEPLVKAVRNRLTPQSAPCKAAAECVRNRAPPAPESAPPQERQMWAPPPEVEQEDRQRRQDGIDANPPWDAREAMESPVNQRTGVLPAQSWR